MYVFPCCSFSINTGRYPTKGIHVVEIAKRNQLDPKKNGKTPFIMLSVNIYSRMHSSFTSLPLNVLHVSGREPDVFANTRISAMLDTRKSVDEPLARCVPSFSMFLVEI